MYLIQSHIIKCVHYKENQMYKAQYAFNMSMIMCPAVHMATRSLLRSSSTHEPSDPLSRVKFLCLFLLRKIINRTQITTSLYVFSIKERVSYLGEALYKTNNMCVNTHITILVPRI